MVRSLRVNAVVLLGALVFALAGPAAGQQVASAAELRVFASHHYHIHTNLTREETVPFGRHMDVVFAQYERRFASYTKRDGGLMPLYLFRTQDQYLAFMKKHGIAAEGSGGMFFVTHSVQGLATWAEGHRRAQTFRTLQHEGFHQFAWHYLGRDLPTWMNEGLAQYFEDAVILESGMELGLANPHRIAHVKDALHYGYAIDCQHLMNLSHRDWSHTLRTNASRSELLYAQAWSMVYFMIHGDDARYLRSFEIYLRLLSNGQPHEEAFRNAFGFAAERALEDRWRSYALRQTADPVNVAAGRLEFLGAALDYKQQRREIMPRNLDELRRDLQQRGFTLTRTAHGLKSELHAVDGELFTYTRPGGETSEFLLLEPSADGLPPRLAAPGLSPEPNLVWEFNRDGEPVFEIDYR